MVSRIIHERKTKDRGGFKSFCKQLWRELNENIWGKAILLVGAILFIGDVIIKITELGHTIELAFSIPLMILFGFLIIRCAAEVLHKEDK